METAMEFRSLLPFGQGKSLTTAGESDPFTTMQREINRLFDDVWQGRRLPGVFGEHGILAPRIDIKETGKGLELTAELPGVDEKDINVELDGDVLSIRGEKKLEKDEKQKDYHVMERAYGMFQRVVPLPFTPSDDVKAEFAKGVLKISLARSPEAAAKVKKIDVRAG